MMEAIAVVILIITTTNITPLSIKCKLVNNQPGSQPENMLGQGKKYVDLGDGLMRNLRCAFPGTWRCNDVKEASSQIKR